MPGIVDVPDSPHQLDPRQAGLVPEHAPTTLQLTPDDTCLEAVVLFLCSPCSPRTALPLASSTRIPITHTTLSPTTAPAYSNSPALRLELLCHADGIAESTAIHAGYTSFPLGTSRLAQASVVYGDPLVRARILRLVPQVVFLARHRSIAGVSNPSPNLLLPPTIDTDATAFCYRRVEHGRLTFSWLPIHKFGTCPHPRVPDSPRRASTSPNSPLGGTGSSPPERTPISSYFWAISSPRGG